MSDLARNAYQRTEANSSNGLQLVVMLYDGAIRSLGEAKASIQKRDLFGKKRAIDRTLAILGELRSTLKLEEGGDIAPALDKLYAYLTARTLEASVKMTVPELDEAIKLLGILNSAWTEIAKRNENSSTVPSAVKVAPAAVPDDPDPSRAFKVVG